MAKRAILALAAAALGASFPASAQETYDPGPPPPLPELGDHEVPAEPTLPLEERTEQGVEAVSYPEEQYGTLISPALAYSVAQRDAWLAQCRQVYSGSPPETCGDDLARYERTYLDYLKYYGPIR